MIRFVLDAVILGLTLAIVFGFGPAFITLVQTSIHRGFKAAAIFAFGVFLNDLFMVTLCVMTSIQVVADPENELFFSIGAGIILILFGIFTFKRKVKDNTEVVESQIGKIIKDDSPHWYTYLSKGFVLNILNPFVWLFWVSSVAVTSGNMGGDKVKVLSFFAITLITCFLVDLLKAWGGSSLKRFFNTDRIKIMNKVIGIGLIIFGLYFIGYGIKIAIA